MNEVHLAQYYDWEKSVREAITKQWSAKAAETEDAIAFFRLAFTHTIHPNKAWFGVHQQIVSLVVGGIFLASVVSSYNDKGVWLLVDTDAIAVDEWKYQPTKSTQKSKYPLFWLHTDSIKNLAYIVNNQEIWTYFSQATDKILFSGISKERDETQIKRKKQRLGDFFLDPQNGDTGFVSYPEEIEQAPKLVEGATYQVTVNAYERNPKARRMCIAHYGAKCFVCGFDFEGKYGVIGRGIIHVHHERALSTIGEAYEVNPITDLKPICPNCHAIIHKRNPAFTVEEVRVMLKD
jgi:predicted HNH restriction endonuclease